MKADRLNPEVFRHPLEFIFAEHDRQRIACAALERLADDPGADDANESAAYILDHLEVDLPLHIADEERDLFPMLKERCLPDDRIEEMLALRHMEHEDDDANCGALLAPLRGIAGGSRPNDETAFSARARAFARFQRRHLGWENGTVLPLAERRLSDDDNAALGASMAARRGLTLPD
ncbi:MAG: hemerythrin domain-containing protein [Alphaproteobacteria bacterium]